MKNAFLYEQKQSLSWPIPLPDEHDSAMTGTKVSNSIFTS